jgi:uncharacterized membrane protein
MALKNRDMEVDLKHEGSKAVIAGKTSVPFTTFVKLVLERKLGNVLKNSGSEPIIMSSELLTELASAPQDSRENQTKFTLVTLGSGVLLGVFIFSLAQIVLPIININLVPKDYIVIAGVLVGLVVLVVALDRTKRRKKADKITETMERLTSLLSK